MKDGFYVNPTIGMGDIKVIGLFNFSLNAYRYKLEKAMTLKLNISIIVGTFLYQKSSFQ